MPDGFRHPIEIRRARKMKLKAVLFLLAECLILSCNSTREAKEIFVPLDYSEESVIQNELNAIEELSGDNPIKALWRSKILSDTVPGNEGALALYSEMIDINKGVYKECIAQGSYLQALTYYLSLEACGIADLGTLSPGKDELMRLAFEDVPDTATPSREGASVAEMIRGTVTVFVDRGLKIERGVGYADAVLGSGFFISRDGYIVTNHHVISDMVDPEYEGFSRLYVRLAEDPDTRIPASVVGYDRTLDLAILKAEVDAPYVFALGSSDALEVGDRVYAIGSPLGLERTITSGIISSVDRQIFTMGSVFQLDAAVNSGNSGGPLIDEQGRVQAIVFAGVQNFQGLNFAIPVEYLKNELPFLINGGERAHPWIAAYGKTARRPGAGAKDEGVEVYYVLPGGSAARAGLREGDVIVSLNGENISSLNSLHTAFMKQPSGIIARLGIVSDEGELRELLVYLEERPSSPGYEFYTHDTLANAFYPMMGMQMVRVSPTSRRAYSITKIIKGSAADESGFSENDPVNILDLQFNDEKDTALVRLYAKKRKNGYLDINIAFAASLDTPNYF